MFFGLESETAEDFLNVRGGQIASEALAQEVQADLYDGAVKRARVDVGMRRHLRLGEIFLESGERYCRRVVHTLRVDPLLVARRSVGAKFEALRGAADAERAEVRDFEDKFVRIL